MSLIALTDNQVYLLKDYASRYLGCSKEQLKLEFKQKRIYKGLNLPVTTFSLDNGTVGFLVDCSTANELLGSVTNGSQFPKFQLLQNDDDVDRLYPVNSGSNINIFFDHIIFQSSTVSGSGIDIRFTYILFRRF